MKLSESNTNLPTWRANQRIISVLALMAILGNSTVSKAEAPLRQTFELTNPASIHTYLFQEGFLKDLQKEIHDTFPANWNAIETLPQKSRKLQWIYNNLRSWNRLQALVEEKKMIVEIKETKTGYVILGCIISNQDPKQPFWQPFVISDIKKPKT